MAKVTGQALWDFCEDLVKQGAGYVWGARGNIYDEAEAQYLYKTYKSGTYNEKYYMVTSMARWKGKIVVDCSGLIQAFRRAKFDGKDNTANGLYENECPDDKKGTIDTLPKKLRGVLLFKKSGKTMTHVGVYGGDGATIEAYGSEKGVIKADPMKTTWTHWGIPTWLEPTDMTVEEYLIPNEPLKVCKVTGCYNLNVRKGPSVNNTSVVSLSKGDVVEVYAIKGNWAKISKTEEQWCSVKYLANVNKYKVTGCTQLNVRKGPSASSAKVKVLNKDDIVWEYGISENGWVKIGFGDCWVSSKYLKIVD